MVDLNRLVQLVEKAKELRAADYNTELEKSAIKTARDARAGAYEAEENVSRKQFWVEPDYPEEYLAVKKELAEAVQMSGERMVIWKALNALTMHPWKSSPKQALNDGWDLILNLPGLEEANVELEKQFQTHDYLRMEKLRKAIAAKEREGTKVWRIRMANNAAFQDRWAAARKKAYDDVISSFPESTFEREKEARRNAEERQIQAFRNLRSEIQEVLTGEEAKSNG